MDKRIKRLLALLSCLALLVPVAVGHGAIGAYATEDGVAVIETATPAPETAATPAPEAAATPVPETEATPAPETEATPAPEAAATPVPETADTPAPGAEDTPIPDMEAGAEAAPDVAALYDALMTAGTEEAFYALADGLDEAAAEAFVAALTGQQQEALLSRLASFAGHTAAATVPYTRAAPFLPAVAVAVARRSAALRETGGDDNGLELFKSAVDNGDGTYTVTLEAYTTGKVIDTTITTPVDIVLVLDQSGSMSDPFVSGMTRQSAMKSAVGNFIDAVREKYDAATADHRIAIVTFGSTASTLRGWTNVDAGGARELKSAIDSLGNPYNQSTNVAAGMDRAEMLMGENYGYTGSNTMRQKVVIVFTDGMPTTQSAFSTGVANSALATSNRIKQSGVTVYAIGIFSGADPGQTYGDEGFDENSDGTVGSHWANASLNTDAADVPAGNRFLNYLSSNASGVTSIGLTEYVRQQGAGFFARYYRGWKIEQAPALAHSGYYLAASNTGELESIFQSIGGQISTPAIELGGETVVRDLLSEYFVLPAGTGPDDIRLYTAAYDGAAFGAREEAQGLTAVVDAAAGTVSVTGFDFNENFVSDEARDECFYGRKLIVEFVVQPRDGFLGGNGVPTNDAASGVYANAGDRGVSAPGGGRSDPGGGRDGYARRRLSARRPDGRRTASACDGDGGRRFARSGARSGELRPCALAERIRRPLGHGRPAGRADGVDGGRRIHRDRRRRAQNAGHGGRKRGQRPRGRAGVPAGADVPGQHDLPWRARRLCRQSRFHGVETRRRSGGRGGHGRAAGADARL